MITVDQIREKLRLMLQESISLDDFEEWMSSKSWNMHVDSLPEAISLVGNIELLLAEFDNGHLSEENLIKSLRILVAFEIDYSSHEQTGSDNATVPFSFQTGLSASSDKQREMVFSYILPVPA
jgi:hypothetical protein